MNSLLSFHVILVFFVLLLLLLLCAIERWQSFMLNVSETYLLHEDLQKVSIFSIRTMPISGLCGQFLLGLCQCVTSEFFLFWMIEPIKEVYISVRWFSLFFENFLVPIFTWCCENLIDFLLYIFLGLWELTMVSRFLIFLDSPNFHIYKYNNWNSHLIFSTR
jgi:hypothetical protein